MVPNVGSEYYKKQLDVSQGFIDNTVKRYSVFEVKFYNWHCYKYFPVERVV